MGLFIISKKDGSSVDELREFKHKVKTAKKLMEEICEDVESMETEYGGDYSERSRYREHWDDRDRERERYRDEMERDRYLSERRRY
ncbi:MAG: hypothetical protein IJT12_08000 [Paludibacteraceae bacterium]|nr:hypothetical protein [Paludibacteraceae bacterium]